MKNDLATKAWQHDIGCPISIVLFSTSDVVCYLKKTRELGIHFKPDPKKGFECYCDTDFSGLWNKAFAPVDLSTS